MQFYLLDFSLCVHLRESARKSPFESASQLLSGTKKISRTSTRLFSSGSGYVPISSKRGFLGLNLIRAHPNYISGKPAFFGFCLPPSWSIPITRFKGLSPKHHRGYHKRWGEPPGVRQKKHPNWVPPPHIFADTTRNKGFSSIRPLGHRWATQGPPNARQLPLEPKAESQWPKANSQIPKPALLLRQAPAWYHENNCESIKNWAIVQPL